MNANIMKTSAIEMAANSLIFGECMLNLSKLEKEFIISVTNEVSDHHHPRMVMVQNMSKKQAEKAERNRPENQGAIVNKQSHSQGVPRSA